MLKVDFFLMASSIGRLQPISFLQAACVGSKCVVRYS